MPLHVSTACRTMLLSCVLTGLSLGSLATAQDAPVVGAAPTVTVQAGDTAYAIARRAGLSVETLLSLNGLQTPDLKVGQVLRLGLQPHTVQAGETPYGLARRYGVSVDALLAANNLTADMKIGVGQLLTLPAGAVDGGPVAAPVVAQASLPPTGSTPGAVRPTPAAGSQSPEPLPADWRSAALALVGTPYVFGGQSRSGTDCSGFVLQVFTPLGIKLPRVSADQAQVGLPVSVQALQPGDLVFFDTTGAGRVTHVGIYLGDDQFVNANSYQGKVTVDRLLSDRYWAPRYLGARRVLDTTVYAQKH